jgi:hypothetical protein
VWFRLRLIDEHRKIRSRTVEEGEKGGAVGMRFDSFLIRRHGILARLPNGRPESLMSHPNHRHRIGIGHKTSTAIRSTLTTSINRFLRNPLLRFAACTAMGMLFSNDVVTT